MPKSARLIATLVGSAFSLGLINLNPAEATTLFFSGNLDSSSFSLLSQGTFTGVGELPNFSIDDLFRPDGVAFTSGSMEFFDSSGQLIPSQVEQGYVRAIDSVVPPLGTPFQAEIIATGFLIPEVPNQEGCIARGGIWIANPPPGRCLIRFKHKDIVETNRIAGTLPWVSGEITVELSDLSQVTTTVTSANFTLQTVPESTSPLGLLALGTLGAGAILNRKLSNSKASK